MNVFLKHLCALCRIAAYVQNVLYLYAPIFWTACLYLSLENDEEPDYLVLI